MSAPIMSSAVVTIGLAVPTVPTVPTVIQEHILGFLDKTEVLHTTKLVCKS